MPWSTAPPGSSRRQHRSRWTPDFDHLSIAGQAAEAETLWPIVKEILAAP
jgi:hypothetical protein